MTERQDRPLRLTVDRRAVLAGSAATGLAVGAVGLLPASAAARAGFYPAGIGNPAGLRLLTSTDGIHTPPRGAPKMKFSFSNPEPSVEFAGLLFGFEIVTFENSYGLDPERVSVRRQGDGRLTLRADGFLWAGGTRKYPGMLQATLERDADGTIEWQVRTRFDKRVKSVKTIVRGLPQGPLSSSAGDFVDHGDDDVIHEYPALMGGMATPLVAIRGEGAVWGLSALQTEVRPARFAFFPGPDGYKTQLIYEQAGWQPTGDVTTCRWRIASAPDFDGVARRHFQTVERNWNLPAFRQRDDAPEWMKHVALVMALHGEHWTGYVFNDFDRQLDILRWTARQIDPRQVMIFLPGWDGRYYWDYPRFAVGEYAGGAEKFRRMLTEGRKLGFRFAAMFGSNIANPLWENWPRIEDAQLRTIYGQPFPSDYVDWDGDRTGEPTMVFMNLAVESWREHLKSRISDILSTYPIDAYFLDICGLWENNPDGDQMLGTRQLVHDLAQLHPGIPPIAEMQYDAQMGYIPMNQVLRYPLYRQASTDVVASYNHLSYPAPGRGSSGVHEIGFTPYHPVTIDQSTIPTITVVDDTFDQHRDLMRQDIATAKARFEQRGGWS